MADASAGSDALAPSCEMVGELDEPLHAFRLREQFLGRRRCRQICSEPPRSNHSIDAPHVDLVELLGEDVGDRRADQLARDVVGALQLAFVFHLELAGNRRQRRVDIGDARDDRRLAVGQRASLGIRQHVFEAGDRQPLADARAPIDLAIGTRLKRDLLDDLAHVDRHVDRLAVLPRDRATPPAR